MGIPVISDLMDTINDAQQYAGMGSGLVLFSDLHPESFAIPLHMCVYFVRLYFCVCF